MLKAVTVACEHSLNVTLKNCMGVEWGQGYREHNKAICIIICSTTSTYVVVLWCTYSHCSFAFEVIDFA